MRILIIVPSFRPANYYGGPIRSVSDLSEALASNGHNVTVLTTDANGPSELDVPLGEPQKMEGVDVIYFHRATKDHSNFSPGLLLYLWRHMGSFDVIHIHSWWNLVAVPSTLICWLRGKVPVITPRGSVSYYTLTHGRTIVKKAVHRLIGRRLLSFALIHVTTERERCEVESILSGKLCVLIPNIVMNDVSDKPVDRDPVVFRILYMGRIDPVKNLELLVQVFSTPFPFPAELLIAGNGNEEYKEGLMRLCNYNPDIRWIGYVDDDEKKPLLASADVVALPSHTENFGNVIIEALAQGTAVLVSEGVGLKDYISENNFGKVVRSDIGSWRQAIEHIYSDRQFLDDVRNRAPEAVASHYGVSSLGRRYEVLYEQAAGFSKHEHPDHRS